MPKGALAEVRPTSGPTSDKRCLPDNPGHRSVGTLSASSPSLLVLTIANPILVDAVVWFAIAQG